MLMVQLRNISDMALISDYEYSVLVTLRDGSLKTIAEGNIKGHVRTDGWRDLVQRVLDESKDIG
jgi:hypothetical protein